MTVTGRKEIQERLEACGNCNFRYENKGSYDKYTTIDEESCLETLDEILVAISESSVKKELNIDIRLRDGKCTIKVKDINKDF